MNRNVRGQQKQDSYANSSPICTLKTLNVEDQNCSKERMTPNKKKTVLQNLPLNEVKSVI